MKTINSEEDNLSIEDLLSENNYPCWYADFDKKNLEWHIGIKFQTKSEEIIISSSSVKKKKLSGLDLAIKLIDLYRRGGKKNIKEWLNV